jgi:hypothetical protein
MLPRKLKKRRSKKRDEEAIEFDQRIGSMADGETTRWWWWSVTGDSVAHYLQVQVRICSL